jgi:hypothetical protein
LLLVAAAAGAAPVTPPREPAPSAAAANPAPSVALLEFMGEFADDDGSWMDVEDGAVPSNQGAHDDGG